MRVNKLKKHNSNTMPKWELLRQNEAFDFGASVDYCK